MPTYSPCIILGLESLDLGFVGTLRQPIEAWLRDARSRCHGWVTVTVPDGDGAMDVMIAIPEHDVAVLQAIRQRHLPELRRLLMPGEAQSLAPPSSAA
jgi:hypothetical protein